MSKNKQNEAAEEKKEAEAAAAEETAAEETAEAPEPEVSPAEKTVPESLLAAEKDKYLRLAAEFDNFKKRSQKEREALYQDVRSDTILKLLPVYDNLERALRQETADEAYKKGVELTMSQLESIFEGMGVKTIETVGKTFDPGLHDAVMHVEDENAGPNEIVEEFQKGFMLGDKVIRFSMVKVAN
ncbi:MAG: nucleotide exchange factor GrpE [Oscillospiraceae bacterium]|nr:nucleotide exchange factor GrpE [Oscillospiraceae bacterium]